MNSTKELGARGGPRPRAARGGAPGEGGLAAAAEQGTWADNDSTQFESS